MKKKIMILLLSLFLVFVGVTGTRVQNVSAEMKAVTLKSHGNLVYQSDAGTIMFFEEDLALLRSKIFSLSEPEENEGGE